MLNFYNYSLKVITLTKFDLNNHYKYVYIPRLK